MSRNAVNVLLVLACALAALEPGAGCLELRDQRRQGPDACTSCHGSPSREGDALRRSAPPFDLAGRTQASRRGVGAHLQHLTASDTHAAFACETCHVVPEHTDSPGHADSALPAEIVFGSAAKGQDRAPRYDAESQTCSDTYCHGSDVGWVPSASSHVVCGSCHGLPPPPPHPAEPRCELCHGAVVDATGIIAPSLHVNGIVEVEERCSTCHGTDPETGAPPPALDGSTQVSAIGVGAHTAHLAGGASSRPLACEECHLVPEAAGDDGHLDPRPAEVVLTGVAASEGRAPTWQRGTLGCVDTWCHGPTGAASPPWTLETGPLGCNGCHGNPPAAPHPQMEDCSLCHGEVIDATGAIAVRALHVDGVVQVETPEACDGCHGSDDTGLPPPALDGAISTTDPGVGAHAQHLQPTAAAPVACEACHRVPDQTLWPGHVDTPAPAEVRFSGVATAFSASPVYDGARCADTYCHGGAFVLGHASGGNATTPLWTLVDGSQRTCTSCHGLPPPPPHPPGPSFCSDCHPGFSPTLQILDASHHVDGIVDLLSPP